MSHLEDLIAEYYEWRGFIVRRNIKVGRLGHGGWEGELDVVAYRHETGELIHLEPSIDAHAWSVREERFSKKFAAGRKHIFKAVFPWLDPKTELRQVAVLVVHPKGRSTVAGGELISIDELVAEVRCRVAEDGRMSKRAIPEQYALLRTVQLLESGYHGLVGADAAG